MDSKLTDDIFIDNGAVVEKKKLLGFSCTETNLQFERPQTFIRLIYVLGTQDSSERTDGKREIRKRW